MQVENVPLQHEAWQINHTYIAAYQHFLEKHVQQKGGVMTLDPPPLDHDPPDPPPPWIMTPQIPPPLDHDPPDPPPWICPCSGASFLGPYIVIVNIYFSVFVQNTLANSC